MQSRFSRKENLQIDHRAVAFGGCFLGCPNWTIRKEQGKTPSPIQFVKIFSNVHIFRDNIGRFLLHLP